MPFITDEDGVDRWVFTQPDDCDRLGRRGPEPDDPPEYDPYDAAADQAEEWAAAQAELSRIEAEEAHDAAGEAWYLGAYGEGGTS